MNRNSKLTNKLWAVLFGAGILAGPAAAQTYDVLVFFNSAGLSPEARLIQGSDGNLYGTIPYSHANGYGTIFKINTSGTTFTTLHSFAYSDGAYPWGGLIQGTDGNLYGTTLQGGTSGKGTIFKIDTNGTMLTTLHTFSYGDGATPYAALTQGTDGNLYGTASGGGSSNCTGGCGTIFKIDTSGATFTTLHNFVNTDGAFPYAGLIQGSDGNLYGAAATGSAGAVYGTVFKINTSGSSFTTLHEFLNGGGATPYGTLCQATDGGLYGTTNVGGASNNGTIFKLHTDGSAFATLHDFAYTDGAHPWAGLIQGTDTNLYGTANQGGASGYGTIFKIYTSGTVFTTLHSFNLADGAYPYAGLIQAADANLYGTTHGGGPGGSGTIFKIDTTGTALTTLHSFAGSDGVYPYGGLIQAADGNFYGTTRVGGTGGYGTIFKIDASGSTLTTLHSFVGSDGSKPFASLIQGADGNLYGTTYSGGTSGFGTIFKIDTNGTALATLHSFVNTDGANPYAGLIQGTDGNLYGTTYQGGASNAGTIFKINTSGSTFTMLHSFIGADGSNPWANLVQATDGNLYGTTYGGGPSGAGTVFRINMSGTTFTTLHSFNPSGDGANPYGGLIQATDGNLYGTAYQGGSGCLPDGCGTIFKINTSGTTFTTLHRFAGSDGANPQAGLIQGVDGNLYGTTAKGGTRSGGTIFKIDTSGSTLTTLHSFTLTDGASPSAALVQAADGSLYGTASGGGPAFGGVLFRLILSGAAFQTTGVTPTSGPASGGTAVSVTGLGFALTDTVSFAGISATGVTPIGPTQIDATTPALSPGTLNDVVVAKLDLSSAQLSRGFFADFLDVPQSDGFHDFIEKIFRAGITAGCGAGTYCRDDSVTRAQMAVFLLRAEHGSAYVPPPCTGIFADVECTPVPAFAVDWIEQLHYEGITGGCSTNPLRYCPADPVTRAQMAVFLLRAEHGPGYAPPACTPPGIFGDVPCPGGFAVDWIEQLYADGVTGGCSGSPLLYCPDSPNTRGQMAVFLAKAFGL